MPMVEKHLDFRFSQINQLFILKGRKIEGGKGPLSCTVLFSNKGAGHLPFYLWFEEKGLSRHSS
jgi:hypothetical protein